MTPASAWKSCNRPSARPDNPLPLFAHGGHSGIEPPPRLIQFRFRQPVFHPGAGRRRGIDTTVRRPRQPDPCLDEVGPRLTRPLARTRKQHAEIILRRAQAADRRLAIPVGGNPGVAVDTEAAVVVMVEMSSAASVMLAAWMPPTRIQSLEVKSCAARLASATLAGAPAYR